MDDGALELLDDELLGQPAVSLTSIDFSNLFWEFAETIPEPQPKKRQQQREEETAARLEKERAKNRRAQARYRQRQKEQREGLEREHAATTTQLHQTREEHAELKHSNCILEALLAVRTDTLGLLERAKAEDAAEQQASGSGSSGAQHGGVPLQGSYAECGNNGGSGWSTAPTLGTASAAAAVAPAAAGPSGDSNGGSSGGNRAPTCSASAGSGEDSGRGNGLAGAAQCEAPPAEGLQPGLAPCTTVGQWLPPFTYHYGFADTGNDVDAHELGAPVGTEALEARQLIEGHREFAGRVREMLAEYDVTGSESVLERLRPLMLERSRLMAAALRHQPAAILELFATSSEPGMSEEQQREKWDAVVAAMRPSPAQREHYMSLLDTYLRRVERLRFQKREAAAELLQASAGADAAHGMAAAHMQARRGAALLRAASDSEFLALLELMSEMGRVSTPLQKARSAAMSWPHFPDILQLMEAFKRMPAA